MIVIHAKRFDKIDNFDIAYYSKDNPCIHGNIKKIVGIFSDEEISKKRINSQLLYWESLLRDRIVSVSNDFAYATFYLELGVPEFIVWEELDEDGFSNYVNFCYFVDNFYLKAFTVYETIGHLLYKYFDLPLDDNKRKEQISFGSALYKLRLLNPQLSSDLKQIRDSPEFENGIKMRNDIAHNHPPYQMFSGNIEAAEKVNFVSPIVIRRTMVELLSTIEQTLRILNNHLLYHQEKY